MLYQCHCSLCRKQGGSVSNTGLIVAADKFRWLAGEALVAKWQRSTGFRSYFCCTCGSTVPNPLRDTGYLWVPAGALDDGGALKIGAQLYSPEPGLLAAAVHSSHNVYYGKYRI